MKEKQNDLLFSQPKISVIIPIYNGGKYLNYSLKSVQEQQMKNIEIILVNDNSDDDTSKIIYNYMKYDKRIKLIENQENRRILFCKSIGALNARGKYIIELDQDDKFIRDDTFNIVYNESEKYGLDMLHFKYKSGNNIYFNLSKINNINNENIIMNQPELKLSIFKTNICVLWGNLIRDDLYKKVIL